MGLFKKKKAVIEACASGKIIKQSDIPDEVFASGVLGPCIGIDGNTNSVISPVNGKVVQVTKTCHAVGILSNEGVEVLVHAGLDTVELKGEGFKCLVDYEQKVKAGEAILEIDNERIRKSGYSPMIVNVITNSDQFKNIRFTEDEDISQGNPLIEVDV